MAEGRELVKVAVGEGGWVAREGREEGREAPGDGVRKAADEGHREGVVVSRCAECFVRALQQERRLDEGVEGRETTRRASRSWLSGPACLLAALRI